MTAFLDRLRAGQVLVADGATGTNLQQRGLGHGVSSERWVLENPEQITTLHRDFILAGSDLVLTSTFGANTIRLEQSGLAGRVAEVNTRAVALARQAGEGHGTLVAGSIGPTGHMLKPLGPLDEEDAVAAFTAQAQALNAAGVDVLVIETQFDLGEAKAAVRAVRSVSQLPLVVSFSYDRGTRTMMGVRPSTMAAEMADLGVNVFGINCGRSLEDNLKALNELRSATSLPIWFKPNAGLPVLDENANPTYTISPEQMGAQVPFWIAAGAQIVGGAAAPARPTWARSRVPSRIIKYERAEKYFFCKPC
jgi:5-methyltetrahydrofolate--homocysteine methyltransferase